MAYHMLWLADGKFAYAGLEGNAYVLYAVARDALPAS